MTTHVIFNGAPIVGGFFRADEEREISNALRSGDVVTLFHDDLNEHDPNAIGVDCPHPAKGEVHIGYLPAWVAPVTRLFLDGGYTLAAVVMGRDTKGQKHPLIRVTATAPEGVDE